MRQKYKLLLRSSFFTIVSCLTIPAYACAESGSVYIGTVCMTAANFCPNGYLEAKGQILQIQSYNALYSLMGIVYGGDGRTTFGIPDLQSRSPVGLGQGAGLSYIPPGQKRGNETITQTISQMPIHNHTATFTPTGGGGPVSVTLSAKQATGQNNPQDGFMLGAGGTGPSAATIYVNPSAAGTNVNLGGITVSGGGSSGGTVNVMPNGGSLPIQTITPQIGIRFCVASEGLYPPRP